MPFWFSDISHILLASMFTIYGVILLCCSTIVQTKAGKWLVGIAFLAGALILYDSVLLNFPSGTIPLFLVVFLAVLNFVTAQTHIRTPIWNKRKDD